MRGSFGRVFAWLVTLLMAGCITAPVSPRGVMDRLRAVAGPQGPDVVVLEIATIEQPPADNYLDQEIWSSVDEQAVGLDRKAALDDNGLRVGVLSGLGPPKFDQLLRSERANPSPHRVTMRSGNAKSVPTGPTRDECSFDLRVNGETKPIRLPQAQLCFAMTPTRLPDGRVKLSLTPQISHGGRALWIQPAEGEGWSLTGQRPVEKHSELSFDVTIAAQEFVLIGTRFDRENTFGHCAFVTTAGDRPTQRMIVVRSRPQDVTSATAPTENSRAPLALQAVKTVRGNKD